MIGGEDYKRDIRIFFRNILQETAILDRILKQIRMR